MSTSTYKNSGHDFEPFSSSVTSASALSHHGVMFIKYNPLSAVLNVGHICHKACVLIANAASPKHMYPCGIVMQSERKLSIYMSDFDRKSQT